MSYFLGIVPPLEVQQQIVELQQHWTRNRLPKHVEPHVTVKPPTGLGDDRKWLDGARDVCSAIRGFSVTLGLPAFFGERVVYLSVHSTELHTLHAALVDGMGTDVVVSPGRDHEGDNYTPHLTLGMASFGMRHEEMMLLAERATESLLPISPFNVQFVRVFHKPGKGERYQTLLDLSLHM